MNLTRTITIAFLGAIMATSAIGMAADAGARNPNMKCGPSSDGQELVWLNTSTHQIWINKEDNLDQAFALATTSWTASSSSEYSIQATATIDFGGLEATYALTITPDADHGSLVVVVSATDGSNSVPLDPVSCVAL